MKSEKDISSEEILAISLKIESEGAKFYSELAGHISDKKVKKFLAHMAKEEYKHEIQFKKLLGGKSDQTFGWKKNKEIRQMIDAEFQTDIFPRLDEIFEQCSEFEGIHKALEFAVEAETVSAEFYSILGECCEDMETKTFLLLLEKEELEHLKYVESLKGKYI